MDRGFTRTVAALWRGAGRKVLVLLQGNGGGGNAGDNHQSGRYAYDVIGTGGRILAAAIAVGAIGAAVAAIAGGGRGQSLIGHDDRAGQGAAKAQQTSALIKLGAQALQGAVLAYHVGIVALGHAVHGDLRRAVDDDLLSAVAVGSLDGSAGLG